MVGLGVGVVVRAGADDGVATGCEPLGDGSVPAVEGDPAGRDGTEPVSDGDGMAVATGTGVCLGTGRA